MVEKGIVKSGKDKVKKVAQAVEKGFETIEDTVDTITPKQLKPVTNKASDIAEKVMDTVDEAIDKGATKISGLTKKRK